MVGVATDTIAVLLAVAETVEEEAVVAIDGARSDMFRRRKMASLFRLDLMWFRFQDTVISIFTQLLLATVAREPALLSWYSQTCPSIPDPVLTVHCRKPPSRTTHGNQFSTQPL